MPVEVIENMVFEGSLLLLLLAIELAHLGATRGSLYEGSAPYHPSQL